MAKLEVKQLETIRDANREKVSRQELAEKFGVSVSRITEIWAGPKNPHYPKALLAEKSAKAKATKKSKAKPKAEKKNDRPVAKPTTE